jgi:hypothetical protein
MVFEGKKRSLSGTLKNLMIVNLASAFTSIAGDPRASANYKIVTFEHSNKHRVQL